MSKRYPGSQPLAPRLDAERASLAQCEAATFEIFHAYDRGRLPSLRDKRGWVFDLFEQPNKEVVLAFSRQSPLLAKPAGAEPDAVKAAFQRQTDFVQHVADFGAVLERHAGDSKVLTQSTEFGAAFQFENRQVLAQALNGALDELAATKPALAALVGHRVGRIAVGQSANHNIC